MDWTDTFDIAIGLYERADDVPPLTVSFVKLREMVLDLEGFSGQPDGCNEKILEAIQMAWLDEYED